MKDIKMFTNTTLDGYGCEWLLDLFGIKTEDSDIIHIDDEDIQTQKLEITNYIKNKEYKAYGVTFIIGLPIYSELYELIDNANKNYDAHIYYINNNAYGFLYNEYNWTLVTKRLFFKDVCCTDLLKNLLITEYKNEVFNDYDIDDLDIDDLIDSIRRITLNEEETDLSKDIKQLFNLFGSDQFFDKIIDSYNEYGEWTAKYDELINYSSEKMNSYVQKKLNQIVLYNIHEINVGVVFANEYIDEITIAVSNNIKNIDILAIVTEDKVIYRSISNMSCGHFAKLYDGQGGLTTGSSNITNAQKEKIVEILFKDTVENEDDKIITD